MAGTSRLARNTRSPSRVIDDPIHGTNHVDADLVRRAGSVYSTCSTEIIMVGRKP